MKNIIGNYNRTPEKIIHWVDHEELLSNVVYEEIKRRTFVSPQYPL